MQDLEQKVNIMQGDISKILKMQKEILERQDDIVKDINYLKKEEKLTQLELEELENTVCTKFFDLRMLINEKYYKLISIR